MSLGNSVTAESSPLTHKLLLPICLIYGTKPWPCKTQTKNSISRSNGCCSRRKKYITFSSHLFCEEVCTAQPGEDACILLMKSVITLKKCTVKCYCT